MTRLLVEKTDPHAANPHLTDESYEYEGVLGVLGAMKRWEDLTGHSRSDSADAIRIAVGGKTVREVDPETGVEVTARRA